MCDQDVKSQVTNVFFPGGWYKLLLKRAGQTGETYACIFNVTLIVIKLGEVGSHSQKTLLVSLNLLGNASEHMVKV